jgi:dolichol kinase
VTAAVAERPTRARLSRELRRKSIHVASAFVPLVAGFLARGQLLTLLLAAVGVALAVEALRRWWRPARHLFLRLTRTLLRPRERRGLTGATWMAIAYAAAVAIFPQPVYLTAMLYNALADAAAALVGGRWGRPTLPGGRSWLGSGAFVVVALAAGVLVPGIPLLVAVAGALAAAGIELAGLPPDDNLWLTLGGGAALWGALLLLG